MLRIAIELIRIATHTTTIGMDIGLALQKVVPAFNRVQAMVGV
jgi:hypothetical protein